MYHAAAAAAAAAGDNQIQLKCCDSFQLLLHIAMGQHCIDKGAHNCIQHTSNY